MCCCCPPIFLLCFWQMAVYFGQFLSTRKSRSSASSKFTNIEESTEIGGRSCEDTEEVLQNFLERDLGYWDARNIEIQRVHHIGKSKDGNPHPILACFLRYKNCQQILLLGHRLKGTNSQMFRDLPQEIITRRKVQMAAFKDARRNGVAASFSQSQPDKLYIRGKLWLVGQKFTC